MKTKLFDYKLNIGKLGVWLFYLSITLELIIVIVDKSNYTNPIEGQLFRITFAGGRKSPVYKIFYQGMGGNAVIWAAWLCILSGDGAE